MSMEKNLHKQGKLETKKWENPYNQLQSGSLVSQNRRDSAKVQEVYYGMPRTAADPNIMVMSTGRKSIGSRNSSLNYDNV